MLCGVAEGAMPSGSCIQLAALLRAEWGWQVLRNRRDLYKRFNQDDVIEHTPCGFQWWSVV
jgi:hypothetical protein